jgi:hypothetical protein
MAKQVHKSRRKAKKTTKSRRQRIRRRIGINATRLERGLRVLSETKDIKTAARAIRVSPERFKLAAKRKATIRKQKGFWIVVRRLPRRLPIFTNGKQVAITVRSKSASLIGRYMSAVGQFLKTNDPKFLAEFRDRSVKDARGKTYEFETNPNALYQLSSAGNEPFEEIYRIVI